METRQLRYFARVAEFGSFSRAADELKIAQSAVSHQILALEHELKVTLLERHSRGVMLTPAGALLLKQHKTNMNILLILFINLFSQPHILYMFS